MAGDKKVIQFNAENVLDVDLQIKVNNTVFLDIKKGQSLPLKETFEFWCDDEERILTLTSCDTYQKLNQTFGIPCKRNCFMADQVVVSIMITTKEQCSIKSTYISLPLGRMIVELSSNLNPNWLGKSKVYNIPKRIKNDKKVMAVGIDLGTSRCCAAVNRNNGIETIALDNLGERLMPSYVSYDEKNAKCGQIVIDRLSYHSKSTVFDAKRILGKSYNEIMIDDCWPFKVIDDNNTVFIQTQVYEESFHMKPEEVSAALLKHMKEKAEDFQGKILPEAVITIPAEFTISQKSATRNAAQVAGWKKVHFLPEPIAASFAYFIERPLVIKQTLLLFDLGGGTLDVCVLEIINDQIQIISRSGNLNLGGRDFDNLLVDYFNKILINKIGISFEKIQKYKLQLKCQMIKECLSIHENDVLDVESFDITKSTFIEITRQKFENLATTLLNKIKTSINLTLSNIKYDRKKIEKVIHVGGGSRMPMIKTLLREIFPTAEHCCLEHPDEAVAIGAAYYAYEIFDTSSSQPEKHGRLQKLKMNILKIFQ